MILCRANHHFCRFCPCYRELKVRIFLPVAEEQGKLCQKAIIDISCCGYGLWTGIAVYASLKRLGCANKFLPDLEVIQIFKLHALSGCYEKCRRAFLIALTTSTFSFLSSALSSSFPPKVSIVSSRMRPQLSKVMKKQMAGFREGAEGFLLCRERG